MRLYRILIFIAVTSVTISSPAKEMTNYGRYWLSLPPIARSTYVSGVVDGLGEAYFEAAVEWLPRGEILKTPETERVSKVRKKVMTLFEPDSIITVMTDLYQDPSNCFINPCKMLYIARDKLLGEDIQDRLISARKAAVEDHQLIEKAH